MCQLNKNAQWERVALVINTINRIQHLIFLLTKYECGKFHPFQVMINPTVCSMSVQQVKSDEKSHFSHFFSLKLLWTETFDLLKVAFCSFSVVWSHSFAISWNVERYGGNSKLAWGPIRGREKAWHGFLTERKWAERLSWAVSGLWMANVKEMEFQAWKKIRTPKWLWIYGSFTSLADLAKVNKVTVGALSNFQRHSHQQLFFFFSASCLYEKRI